MMYESRCHICGSKRIYTVAEYMMMDGDPINIHVAYCENCFKMMSRIESEISVRAVREFK